MFACAFEDVTITPRTFLEEKNFFKKKLFAVLTRVPAAKLDGRVAHVRDALAVLLVAQVHAVGVAVTAPPQGDAQAVHPTLELVCVAAPRGTRGCKETQVNSDCEDVLLSLLPLLLPRRTCSLFFFSAWNKGVWNKLVEAVVCKLDGNRRGKKKSVQKSEKLKVQQRILLFYHNKKCPHTNFGSSGLAHLSPVIRDPLISAAFLNCGFDWVAVSWAFSVFFVKKKKGTQNIYI